MGSLSIRASPVLSLFAFAHAPLHCLRRLRSSLFHNRILSRLPALFVLLLALLTAGRAGGANLSENFGYAGTIGMNVTGVATTVDAAGNVYIAGNFEAASFTLGAVTLSKFGVRDAFVAKLDASGTVLWAKRFGGSGAQAFCKSIAVDGSGNVYLGGNFSGDNLTVPALTKTGSSDAFALKLDSAGTTLWAKNYGGIGAGMVANGIAVDGSGNAHLSGYFFNANLSTPALALIGSIDAFAFKLDSSGNTTWAKNFGGGGGGAIANAIAVDGSGNVYLSGHFYNANLTTPALAKIGDQDSFALKLDSAGNTAWAKRFGGIGATAVGSAIAVDGSGNVYLGGYFYNANLSTPALSKIGSRDAFAFKLDSAGTTTWAKNYGGAGAGAMGTGIAVDGGGNAYLGGYFYNASLTTPVLTRIGAEDAFALKLDAAGNTTWGKNYGGAGAKTYGFGIAADGSGNVYLGGYFLNASLTTPALGRIGAADTFAFKLNSSGNVGWAKNYGGGIASGVTGDAYVTATAVDASGNIHIAGYFSSSVLTVGSVTLYKKGTLDSFAAKLDAVGTVLWAKNYGGGGAGAVGTSIAVDGSGNVYLGGYFYNASLTTPVLAKIGNLDAFAFKLDSEGTTVWAKSFGGVGASAFGNGIAVDGSGNVYVGGNFYNANLSAPPLVKIGNQDAFALKLNSSGTTVWGKNFGGSGAGAKATGICVDGSGNVYLGGYLDSNDLTTPALARIGTSDAFAFKLNSSGNTSWARNYGGAGADVIGNGIAVDGSGNVYLGGYFQTAGLTTPALAKLGTRDAFAFKLDSAGNTSWARSHGGVGASTAGYGIAADGAGNVYLGGYFSDANLSAPVLTKIGDQDAFAVKINAVGSATWAKNYGGVGAYAFGNGIAVDGDGSFYLGGYFYGDNLSTPLLTKIGDADALIIKQSTKADQTVNFGAAPSMVTGGTGAVSASATSGLAVTLASTTADVCTIAGTIVTGVSVGVCTISGNQAGNAAYNAAATATQSFPISLAGTTTNLGSSSNPSVFGQSVSMTAIVAGNAPGGSVTFNDGQAALCIAVPLSGAQAGCTTSALTVGAHSITAVYSGDSGNAGSTSSVLTQTVNKAGTQISIAAHTPNPSVVGTPIAVTVDLAVTAPGAGIPSGVITVGDGQAICVITTPAVSCNLTLNTLGARTLTAVYGGNSSYSFSTSAGVGHTVTLPVSSTIVNSSANPSISGRSVTFTASVSGASPTGTVQFKDGAASIGGCTAQALVGGTASCATNALTPGSHNITAVYSGDIGNGGSVSSVLVQKVLGKASLILPALMLLLD